jgi:hypothetical protein
MVYNPYPNQAPTEIVIPRWLLPHDEISIGAKVTYSLMAAESSKKSAGGIYLKSLSAMMGDKDGHLPGYLDELEKCSLIKLQGNSDDAELLHYIFPLHPWMGCVEYGNWDKVHGHRSKISPAVPYRCEGSSVEQGQSQTHIDEEQPLSRHSYETCMWYAKRVKRAGEPIKDVKGFSTYLYWSSKQDDRIDREILSSRKEDDLPTIDLGDLPSA